MDGGRVAARGFQYQYLQTLTRILPFIQSADADILTLRVEGPAESAETTGLDVVDFDVVNTSGNLLLVAQVKSRSSEYTMSCSEAIDILFRLIGVGESDRYELITNARSSRDLDRLIELQGQTLSDDDYRKELQSLLVRSPQRLRRLAELSNQDVGRLRRCRIELDPRDDYEVRDNLRETLRTHRIRMGLGSGFYSSGLLTGYMISEILRRAADETDSSIGMESIEGLIGAPNQDLVQALGRSDWGLVAGPMKAVPSIARVDLLDVLAEHFMPRTSGDRAVRTTLVKGLSGIGKSSLASQYVAHRADMYDGIMWIDAESPESIRSCLSVISLVLGLNLANDVSCEELLIHFSSTLASTSWPWLLVLDNAPDLQRVSSLIPAIGRGDVVVTTVDSTAHLDGCMELDMPVMAPAQARELFLSHSAVAVEDQSALDGLLEELGWWPLAIQLAAAYVRTSGIGEAEIAKYRRELRERSIGDNTLAPPGYPRSVTEAVALSLNQLRGRAKKRDFHDPASAAEGCLNMMAYLGARQIPIHLLLAAINVPPERLEGYPDVGLITVEGAELQSGEVIRELLRNSLVSNDHDLPRPSFVEHQGYERTIAANSLVQEVVRSTMDERKNAPWILSCLAEHVRRWLSAAMGGDDQARVFALLPHASTLAYNIVRINSTYKPSALLIGNLAAVYLNLGLMQDGRRLLEMELSVLGPQNDPDRALEAQTLLSISQAIIISHDAESYSIALNHLERLYSIAAEYAVDSAAAANYLTTQARLVIVQSRLDQTSVAWSALLAVLEDLLTRLPRNEMSDAVSALHDVNTAISANDLSRAQEICSKLLEDDLIGGSHTVETRRLLAEILAKQGRWMDARDHIAAVLDACAAGMFPHSLNMMTQNLGFYLSVMALVGGQKEQSSPLLQVILDAPCVAAAAAQAGGYVEQRFNLLVAIESLLLQKPLQDSAPSLESLLEPTDTANAGWAMLLALYRRKSGESA